MKTILAPIDFSTATNGVVAAAAALARSFEGRVVLLNVSQPPVVLADGGTFMFDMGDLMDRTAKDSLAKLERLRDKLTDDFIEADVIQITGHPVTLIIEEARKLKADYIVIGSHGHTAFYDLMVGSTAAGVVKRAPCPVVVVPRPPLQKKKKKTAGRRRVNFPPVVATGF
jgi:nucleotide-binding universal stress UspA family protein